MALTSALAETVVLDCEQFAERGGWSVDSQFIDEMGSSDLLAHGLGKPVADASTTFEFRKAGRYNVFARMKNWTAKWSGAKGGGTVPGSGGRSPHWDGMRKLRMRRVGG